jgi:thiamine-monophosphate kinase
VKTKRSGEDELIRLIQRTVKSRGRVRLGVGDDAAILADGTVITTDAYAEGVHFDLSYMSLRQVGERCACGAISDVVAMGAEPEAVLVALALPRVTSDQFPVSSCPASDEVRSQMAEGSRQKCGGGANRQERQGRQGFGPADEFRLQNGGLRLAVGGGRLADGVRELYVGIENVCREMGAEVAGGDIIAADRLLLALTVTGRTRTPKLRSGARPGDGLYVTGYLGAAEAGRLILAEQVKSQEPKVKSQSGGPDEVRSQKAECSMQSGGWRRTKGDWRLPLVRRHLRPTPRLWAMRALRRRIHGLIDTSDGLATDARHLAEMSGVRIVLDADSIPVLPGTRRVAAALGRDPVSFVLSSGEDYELLFTAKGNLPSRAGGVSVSRVGRIEAGTGLYIEQEGRARPVDERGYDHINS